MSQPDVSVLMTVHNGVANYPEMQLNFALQMAWHEYAEVNVFDDGSTDDTRDILAWWSRQFDNINLATCNERLGAASGYRIAASMATGRYCILQSVRSWYEEGALKAMAQALDENPDVGFVYGWTQYHGAQTNLHKPPPFKRERFFKHFDSLFGFMFRREALDAGCEFVSYFERDGRAIDICDYDFVMQLICKMGWRGLALDRLCLNYHYSGEGQMTNLVHKYQADIDAEFARRWGQYA